MAIIPDIMLTHHWPNVLNATAGRIRMAGRLDLWPAFKSVLQTNCTDLASASLWTDLRESYGNPVQRFVVHACGSPRHVHTTCNAHQSSRCARLKFVVGSGLLPLHRERILSTQYPQQLILELAIAAYCSLETDDLLLDGNIEIPNF
jgi:hypothetical protein